MSEPISVVSCKPTFSHLFPAIVFPDGTPVTFIEVCNVGHDTPHGTGKQHLVFIVHGNNDEDFRLSRGLVELFLPEGILFCLFNS